MEEQILQKLEEQTAAIEKMQKTVDQLRKYFLWTLVITIVTVILPIIGLAILIPWLLQSMTSSLQGIL
jgi:cation transport ATPase